jgi:23S rRNA pseudouridine2605 synthase
MLRPVSSRPASPWIPRRLDKFVREAAALSLAAIREAWLQGRIRVQPTAPVSVGGPVLDLNQLIYEGDLVELDAERLVPRTQHYTAVLNKPKGVTSTAKDPLGKPDLSRWLRCMPAGMFAVGRLDRETTGLLLFTTDGELADAVLQPRRHTDKVYWLWLDEELPPEDPRLSAMTRTSPDFDCAKQVSILHRSPDHVELLMTLDQGKHHQIRRLCRALDLRLMHLHRRSIGPLQIGDLALGSWRALSAGEVDALWAAVGGCERVREAQLAALRRHAQKWRADAQPDTRLEAWLERHAPPAAAQD